MFHIKCLKGKGTAFLQPFMNLGHSGFSLEFGTNGSNYFVEMVIPRAAGDKDGFFSCFF